MIRIADLSDIEKIAEINKQLHQFHCDLEPKTYIMPDDECFSDFLMSALGNENCEIFIYEDNGIIKGYALITKMLRDTPLKIRRKVCLVEQLAVSEKYRHQGIGTELLKYIKTYVKDNDLDVLKICVRAENNNAYRLYEKMGFEPQLITMEIKLK